jgi:hypothetical protein
VARLNKCFLSESAIYSTYSECVSLALYKQRSKRILLCFQVFRIFTCFRIWQYHVFSKYSKFFSEKKLFNKNSYLPFVYKLGRKIFSKENSAIFRHDYTFVFIKVAIILVILQPCINFPHNFGKLLKYFFKYFSSHTNCYIWVGGLTDGWT